MKPSFCTTMIESQMHCIKRQRIAQSFAEKQLTANFIQGTNNFVGLYTKIHPICLVGRQTQGPVVEPWLGIRDEGKEIRNERRETTGKDGLPTVQERITPHRKRRPKTKSSRSCSRYMKNCIKSRKGEKQPDLFAPDGSHHKKRSTLVLSKSGY